jgi:hypothetical protein
VSAFCDDTAASDGAISLLVLYLTIFIRTVTLPIFAFHNNNKILVVLQNAPMAFSLTASI